MDNEIRPHPHTGFKNVQFDEVDPLQKILRGEIAAVEAYTKAIHLLKSDAEKQRLLHFLTDHENAVMYWKGEIEHKMIQSEDDSGIWGDFVNAILSTAKFFGNSVALETLRVGEQHGLDQYKDMLKNPHVGNVHKTIIKERFIPEIESHMTSLLALKKLH